jgi:hypothetical protein
MMRLALLGVLVGAAALSPADQLWKVARGHEESFRRALMTKDLTWLERVAAPGFYGQERDGTRNSRAKTLATLKEYLSRRTLLEIEPTLLKVARQAGGMLVRVKTRFVGEAMPIWPVKIRRESTTTHEEFWTREKAGWRLRWMRQLEEGVRG